MPKRHRSPVWKMTPEEFRRLVDNSTTMTDVLAHFGLENKGSNHITVKQRCAEEGVDLSGLRGRSKQYVEALRQKMVTGLRYAIEDVLVANSTYSRASLRRQLCRGDLIPYGCAVCGCGPEWMGKVLVLVLDHINGVPNDNRIENLRFICPNCNSQTSTFAGRNRR